MVSRVFAEKSAFYRTAVTAERKGKFRAVRRTDDILYTVASRLNAFIFRKQIVRVVRNYRLASGRVENFTFRFHYILKA